MYKKGFEIVYGIHILLVTVKTDVSNKIKLSFKHIDMKKKKVLERNTQKY